MILALGSRHLPRRYQTSHEAGAEVEAFGGEWLPPRLLPALGGFEACPEHAFNSALNEVRRRRSSRSSRTATTSSSITVVRMT